MLGLRHRVPARERWMLEALEAMARSRSSKIRIRAERPSAEARATGQCWARRDSQGRLGTIEIIFDPGQEEPVLTLAHEMGHAWDRLEGPDIDWIRVANYRRHRPLGGYRMAVMDDERRAWEWAELFLRRVGFFARRSGWRRFVRDRQESLDLQQERLA